jgi:hypothetical protein
MNNTILDQHIPCDDCGSSDAKCTYEDGHSYCFSCLAYTPPPKKEFNTLDELYSYEYLPIRGITKDTLQFYDVKTKIDSEGKPRSIGFLIQIPLIRLDFSIRKHFILREI